MLAGRLRSAGAHLEALAAAAEGHAITPLTAQLQLLQGENERALATLGEAIDAPEIESDLTLRASLHHHRGLARLETADFLGGLSDLAEAERVAKIAGDTEAAALARLDMAEALLTHGDIGSALAAMPPERALSGEARIRAAVLKLRLEWEADGEPAVDPPLKSPVTLAEAGQTLAVAGMAAGKGKHAIASTALDLLEETGWLDAVEIIRGEVLLLRASQLLTSGRADAATSRLEALEGGLSPRAARRLEPAALWLRMRSALALGRPKEALRAGRVLLRSLERQRAGIFALQHLFRLSGDNADFYRAVISLELRYGRTEKAYETLQQFSARALLRRSGRRSESEEERLSLNRAPFGEEHPGRWSLRGMLRRLASRRPEALRWPQLIRLLRHLGSEDYHKQPDDEDN